MTCLTYRAVAFSLGKTLFLFFCIISTPSACAHEAHDESGTTTSQNPPTTSINALTASAPKQTPAPELDPSRERKIYSNDSTIPAIQQIGHEIAFLHNDLASLKGAVVEIGRDTKLLTSSNRRNEPDHQKFETFLGSIATQLTEISKTVSELKNLGEGSQLGLNATLENILTTLQELPGKFPSPYPVTQHDQSCKPLEPKDWLTAGSLFIAAIAFSIGTFRQLHYKRIDTMLEFQERFHDLVDRDAIQQSSPAGTASTGGIDAERLNWLHWSLQHQQYSTWRRGLLPHNTYHFWMSRRVLDKGTHEKKMGIAEWDSEESYFLGTHYYLFMKALLKFPDNTLKKEEDIDRVRRPPVLSSNHV